MGDELVHKEGNPGACWDGKRIDGCQTDQQRICAKKRWKSRWRTLFLGGYLFRVNIPWAQKKCSQKFNVLEDAQLNRTGYCILCVIHTGMVIERHGNCTEHSPRSMSDGGWENASEKIEGGSMRVSLEHREHSMTKTQMLMANYGYMLVDQGKGVLDKGFFLA